MSIKSLGHVPSVDFPLPVRPSSPTFSPAFNEKDTPRSTGSNSGAYRITKSLTFMNESSSGETVVDGQYAGTDIPSITLGGS